MEEKQVETASFNNFFLKKHARFVCKTYKVILAQCSIFMSPENVRRPLVTWRFQGV